MITMISSILYIYQEVEYLFCANSLHSLQACQENFKLHGANYVCTTVGNEENHKNIE